MWLEELDEVLIENKKYNDSIQESFNIPQKVKSVKIKTVKVIK
jgi:hypothetical protein